MAAGAFDDDNVPAPERDIKNPPPNQHTDMYVVRKLNEIDLNQAKILLLIDSLRKDIDSQTQKLDKTFDKVVSNREEFIETDTKLKRVIDDCEKIDTRLDRVRIYVFGAAAVLAVITIFVPPLVARYLAPANQAGAAVGPEQSKLPRRN